MTTEAKQNKSMPDQNPAFNYSESTMPESIAEDEAELLNHLNREEYFGLTVDKILQIEHELNEHSQGLAPKSRNEIKKIKNKRSYHLYNLLLYRNYDPDLGISVKLVQGIDEELHPFSQNRIVINTVYPMTQNQVNFVTNIDILARTLPPSTSSDVMNLIGQPDNIDEQWMDRYIERVFEEANAAQKAYCQAEKAGDNKTVLAAAKVCSFLLPNRLMVLRDKSGIHIGFDEDKYTFYFYKNGEEDKRIFEIKYDEQTDDLIEKSGGVTLSDD